MGVEEKKKKKYAAILAVSEELMLANGLHALNMNDVAKAAKMAKGTLYLYFKSREEIIAALALKARRLLLEKFKAEISTKDHAIEKLKGIIQVNYWFLKQNKLYYDLVSFYEIDERDTETPEMQQAIGQTIDLIIAIVVEGKARGEIRPSVDPVTLAFSMWGMTVGVMQLVKVKAALIATNPSLNEQKVVQDFIEIFEAGIKK